MGNQIMFEVKEGTYYLKGDIYLDTVAEIYGCLRKVWLPQDRETIKVDMSGVDRVDSSLIALLLQWKAECIRNNISIEIDSLPNSLVVLSKMSSVHELLVD